MVRLKADAVIAGSGAAARAVMGASRTLPIVTLAAPDPVRSGLVARLARPGAMRSVAEYVARILRGAWPGELPVEQPMLFEFVVNAKAARAIGLEVTPDLRLRADVILD